jgi:high-affinity nickel-transport protein
VRHAFDDVGFMIVGLFLLVWAWAIAYWKFSAVEQRWAEPAGVGGTEAGKA